MPIYSTACEQCGHVMKVLEWTPKYQPGHYGERGVAVKEPIFILVFGSLYGFCSI
jgi:hypothetical protein